MDTTREKFIRVMRHGDVSQGFPVVEAGGYWDLTHKNWLAQGLPKELAGNELFHYFGLEPRGGYWKPAITEKAREEARLPPDWRWEQPMIHCEADYDRIRPYLFAGLSDAEKKHFEQLAMQQAAGSIWGGIALDGPFWHPRMLLGVEPHLLAFYEQPCFMKRMIDDLTEYNLRMVEDMCAIFSPDLFCFAEDMCYRGGSMISRDVFEEFMAPHYRAILPGLRKRDILVTVDTDGQLEPIIPWFIEVGLQGMSPMERRAGVDVNRIREMYPAFAMSGGYDKTVMDQGEARVREEFERIKPAVMGGYFIPTVDHQVPPNVSLEDYKMYCRLLREFSEEVARETRARKARERKKAG